MITAEAITARGEAADAAAHAARQAEVLIRIETQRLTLELFKRLEQMDKRLADVDMTFWPIQERVLRSRVQIGHISDELLASGGQRFDPVRLELINALWWEIRAIGFLRKHLLGRPLGAIGPNQKALRALLKEDPDADTHGALLRLNQVRPAHDLKRSSITVELSRARKALGIKRG